MASNQIFIQVDVNSQGAQGAVNALNQAIAQTGPTAEKSSQQSTKALSTVNVSVKQTTEAFGEMATALAGLGIGRMIQNMAQMATEMGRAQTQMEAFTGSAKEAKELYEEIRQVAQQGIFNVPEMEQAAQALLGFGFAAKNVPGMLKIITDQVTAMGGSIETVNTLIRLFGRISDKEFTGANDLFRLLPASGIKVTEALRVALGKLMGDSKASVSDVQKALKDGVLNPAEVIRVVLEQMQNQTKDAGLKVNDFTKALKNFNDVAREAAKIMFGPDGFGPAIKKLTDFLQELLVPLAALFDLLKKMPEKWKEVTVDVIAAAVAFTSLYAVFQLISFVSGPLITAITAIAKVLKTVLLPALIEMLPTLLDFLPAFAAITASAYIYFQLFPEEAKGMTDKVKKTFGDMFTWLKDKTVGMANDSGLVAAIKKIFNPTADTGQSIAIPKFDEMQKQLDEWGVGAQKTLLEALGSPADVVKEKYVALFAKLEEKLKEFGILEKAAGQKYRDQLEDQKQMEISAKAFAQEKKQIEETAKYDEEMTKGSYDAQIAYIEAKDEQDMRRKVANIDTVTHLHMESIEKVAAIQEKAIQDEVNRRNQVLEGYKDVLIKAGVKVEDIQDANLKEAAAKELLIAQKASDEEQKIRLEGWKKANDAIIEEQKRVYDAFKSEFDELFDALTDRSKSLGQALGDMFKKLALGEVKNLFSSTLAASATAAAGYGQPEAEVKKGAGIFGFLFSHGMPPRPPGPAPDLYVPASADSGVHYAQQSANRFADGADTFADAVNVFAAVAKGSANRVADASGDFASASAATGVPAALLRAVTQVESGGNASAISPKGAIGLMQLMPRTAASLGVTNPLNPAQNVMGGATYLGQMLTRYGGSVPAALAAYNMGPTAYDRAMAKGQALPSETRAYVAHVQSLLGGGQGGADDMPLPLFQLPPGFSTASGQLSYTPTGVAVPPPLLPPAPDVPMPNYGNTPDLPGSLTMGATPTQLQTAAKAGVLAHVAAMMGGAGGNKTGMSGLLNINHLKDLFGIGGATSKGGTSIGSVLSSQGVAGLAGMAGTAAIGMGLQKRSTAVTVAGGALAGVALGQQMGMGYAQGPLMGAGLGLLMAGVQRGGGAGLAMDVGGGALAGGMIGLRYGGMMGGAIGAAVGAGVGAITGIVRMFVKTEQEKIRAGIKQVYGIDISNRQILTQIQTDIDQKYGGNVAIGIRSQDVQDIVRLYALSTGQAANLPRPMYSATIAQSTQGLQMQPVYQGGVLVQNPYTGPTTYQYQTAVTTAQGLMSGTNLGVPGAGALQFGLLNSQTLNILAANPSAVAISGAAAARAGDSRLSTTQAMQEPLTALS